MIVAPTNDLPGHRIARVHGAANGITQVLACGTALTADPV